METRNMNSLRAKRAGSVFLSFLFVGSSLALAQTATVTTTDDVVDFGGLQQVADLPGPDGRVSFREACMAANNTPGPQTIAFQIPPAPEAEWWSGVAMLFMDYDVFPLSDDETTVDFTTQTAFTGDTNPDGNEVGLRCAPITGAPAIFVSGDRCVIKGLDLAMYVGYAVQLYGNDNRVVACTIDGPLHAAVYITGGFGGPAPTGNIVGSTDPSESNRLVGGNSGVRIDGPADGNIVIGNYLSGAYAGVEVRGVLRYGIHVTNNRIGGPSPEERNIISGAGYYGEEGFPVGQQVSLEDAEGTIVEGNYIGTTTDGMGAAPQIGPVGISVRGSIGTVIRDNLIGGIAVTGGGHYSGQRFGDGIAVTGTSIDTTIIGNRIGITADGTGAIPNLRGITVQPFTALQVPEGTVIGGAAPDEGNVIAHSELMGVMISSLVSGVHLSGNAIFDNGELGIDLLPFSGDRGVTPNDPGDADTGANELQNFPELASATASGPTTIIEGSLNSLPGADYTIEFFASPACDSSGYGEGARYLGATSVTTDGGGDADFSITLPVATTPGEVVTATAIDSSGNTSEFSACLTIEGGTTPGDIDGDGDVDLADLAALLAAYETCDGDPGYEPAADLDASGCVGLGDLAILLASYSG